MQTKSIIISLLFAACGINAAPAAEALVDRQTTTIPVQIYDSAGCNNGPTPATTVGLNTDGSCQGIAPILTANTDSAIVNTATTTLPAGCSIVLYSDTTCSSQNFLTITGAGQCVTFGAGKFIFSAKTVGTC